MARSLIEQWFPAAVVGAESLRERGSAKAYPPVNFIHVWWARRPLTISRAAVVASLLPAWPTEEEATSDPEARRVLEALRREFPAGERAYHAWFVQALGIVGNPVKARAELAAANAAGVRLKNGGYGYDRAFTVNPTDATLDRLVRLAGARETLDGSPVVLDPFAGGGSIPFEAARFGCTTIANELNPVAVAVLHGTIDVPGRLGTRFAKVIEHWGTKWAERVERRLAPFFPKAAGEDSIAAYIWAHTIPCPSTGHPTPLAPNYWLATGAAGRDVAVELCPDHGAGVIRTRIIEGPAAATFGERATYGGGTATSIWDPTVTISGEDINRLAQDGQLGQVLLAVSVTRPGVRGRQFRPPSDADLEAVAAAEAEVARLRPRWEIDDLVPVEPIPSGSKTDEPRRMGLFNWADAFAPRQLLTNVIALEELRAILAEARSELDHDDWRAVGLELAVAVDRVVDYNSRFSSWHATRTMVRNTFDRHDFGFKWSFAEFDGSGAIVSWAARHAATNFRNVATLLSKNSSLLERERASSATILLGSATDLGLPDASVDVVVTDPPYYDNVQYAELSDFFYVWLKRSLRDTWPELCAEVLTNKQDEAVANPALFRDVATHKGRGKRVEGAVSAAELADQRYEELLTESFREAHRVLKSDGVLTVMFTHKRVDAWDTLGAALLEAGFEIGSSWPVHTESEHSLHQARQNSASSTILLGCRKREAGAEAYWGDIRDEVQEVVEDAARRFAAEGMRGVDLTLSTYGPALSVLSRHWSVYTGNLTADGTRERLRPDVALDLARQRVAALKKAELLGGRTVEFDRATDWWLLAWNDFQAAQFPAGEALKLCIATDVELDDLARMHKLVKASGGNVTLLTPAQRRTARGLDVDAGVWPTQIDGLHALMLVHDEEGLSAARAWLRATGKGDDPKFAALFEAALHAVPRAREKGQFVRPEARILESLRASLFDHVAAPAEPEVPPAQAALFDT